MDEEEIKLKENPIKMMIKEPRLFINLMIVCFSWIACSFNYFLISFDVKHLGGNIFINTSLITFAGLTGKIIVIIVRKNFSSKLTLFSCF